MERLHGSVFLASVVAVFLGVCGERAAALTITLPEHGDLLLTLRNDLGLKATDLDIRVTSGTRIGKAIPDGVVFGDGAVSPGGDSAIFTGGNGVPAGDRVNLLFSRSFAKGTVFEVQFSYPSPIFQYDPTIVGDLGDYTETIAPVPVPAAAGLLAAALATFGAARLAGRRS